MAEQRAIFSKSGTLFRGGLRVHNAMAKKGVQFLRFSKSPGLACRAAMISDFLLS
jgi:hypothetical protein